MPLQLRKILSTSLAGIVTPALAALFYLVGSSLCQGDVSYRTFLLMSAYLMVLAVIFGAPFAIPAVLGIRLDNTWRAVPFIAFAAALGIEIQLELIRHYDALNPFDPVSLVLMLIWIIPTILGTVAVLLLKWRSRPTSLAIASIAVASLIVCVVVGVNKASVLGHPYMAASSWGQLRVGAQVFAGDDGSAFSLTVCPSLSTILADQPSEECRRVPPGTPAIVDAIIPCRRTDSSWNGVFPHVRLRASDGTWTGFADAGMLQPSIPVGTVIELSSDWNATLEMKDDSGETTNLGDNALVEVLRYDPRRQSPLFVKIIDGAHRDQTGWTSLVFANAGASLFGDGSLIYPFVCLMV
jgi:hypothetical protein